MNSRLEDVEIEFGGCEVLVDDYEREQHIKQ